MPRKKSTQPVGPSTETVSASEEMLKVFPAALVAFRPWADGSAIAKVLADSAYVEHVVDPPFQAAHRRLLVMHALGSNATDGEITALRAQRIPDGQSLFTWCGVRSDLGERVPDRVERPRDARNEFYRCLAHATLRAGLAQADQNALISVASEGLAEGLAPDDWESLVTRVSVPLARFETMHFAAGLRPAPLPFGLVEAKVRRELADEALRSALTFLGSLRGVRHPSIALVGEHSLRLMVGPCFLSMNTADVSAAKAERVYDELVETTGVEPMAPATVYKLGSLLGKLLGSPGTPRPHERPVVSHESRTVGLGLNAERDKITFDGKDIFYLEGTNPKPKWIGPKSDVGKLLLSLKVLGRVSEQVEGSDSRGRLNRVTAFPGCVTGRAKNLRLAGILASTPISDDLKALAPTR